MDFLDTCFFRIEPLRQLPSPASILQQFPDKGFGVVKCEHINVVVKFGDSSYLRLEEAQTMRAVKQVFASNEVPVPEVFGWRKYGDQNFIYMSIISGQTLREAWPALTEEDKQLICGDLGRIVGELRRVSQVTSDHFIGTSSWTSQPYFTYIECADHDSRICQRRDCAR